jgi:hypothetical protein
MIHTKTKEIPIDVLEKSELDIMRRVKLQAAIELIEHFNDADLDAVFNIQVIDPRDKIADNYQTDEFKRLVNLGLVEIKLSIEV